MFRLAYRNFGDHESLVGNFTVNSGGVAGIRWFELRDVTAGPVTVFQESTYQPDTTWRWMGSAAMDGQGNLHFFLSEELREVVLQEKSVMPENYGKLLSEAELQNLLAFLSRQTVEE
jgi:hypothetical protein